MSKRKGITISSLNFTISESIILTLSFRRGILEWRIFFEIVLLSLFLATMSRIKSRELDDDFLSRFIQFLFLAQNSAEFRNGF